MATSEAKPMLKVSRSANNQSYPGSVLARCSFCRHEVWVSKAAVDLVGNYHLACEKCAPARIVKGPTKP